MAEDSAGSSPLEDDGVAASIAGELALHDPMVRRSAARSGELLDRDFVEIGSSGRRWNRAEMIIALSDELTVDDALIRATDMRGVRLAEDLVHLTYRTDRQGRQALRSSLWRRTDGRWRLLFHQGTPSPETSGARNARDAPGLVVGGADAELDAALGRELTTFNEAVSGVRDQRELTVQVRDDDGALVGGLSGWTWGTCAGVGMFWIRGDARRSGWGSRLLAAAEQEAVARGCEQMVLSSFTFQAPAFYRRHGYTETGRTEGLPVAGMADVHLRKDLRA